LAINLWLGFDIDTVVNKVQKIAKIAVDVVVTAWRD
jgi:hypothetical protein